MKTTNPRIAHFQRVDGVGCEFYLRKAVKRKRGSELSITGRLGQPSLQGFRLRVTGAALVQILWEGRDGRMSNGPPVVPRAARVSAAVTHVTPSSKPPGTGILISFS